MQAVDRLLVSREERLVKLLDPPFDTSSLEPGYIKGYVPGIRENGGQYSHAAIWVAMAFAMMGEPEHAWELFSMLNPISRASDETSAGLYRVEPYVMCADVYAAPPHTGRGGWTWYTGAAGWMYRLALETLIGLTLEVDKLRVAPRIPVGWQSCKIHYRYRSTFHHITLKRVSRAPEATETSGQVEGSGRGAKSRRPAKATRPAAVTRIVVDGVELRQSGPNKGPIPLSNDRRDHYIEVEFDSSGTGAPSV
jgi:cellobiose phosphorylase